jgi:hypothetical protein
MRGRDRSYSRSPSHDRYKEDDRRRSRSRSRSHDDRYKRTWHERSSSRSSSSERGRKRARHERSRSRSRSEGGYEQVVEKYEQACEDRKEEAAASDSLVAQLRSSLATRSAEAFKLEKMLVQADMDAILVQKSHKTALVDLQGKLEAASEQLKMSSKMLQAEVVLRDLMEGKLEFQSSQYEEKLGILRRTVKAGSKLLQVQLSAKGLVEIKLRDAVNRVLDLVEEAGHLACRVAQKDEGMAAEVSRLNAKMEQHYIQSEEKLKQSGSQIIKMEVERERLNNFVGLKCQQYESKKEEAARLGDLLNISSKAAAEYRKEVKWLKEEYERRAAVLDEECPVVMKQLLKETQQAQRQEYMSDLEKAQEHPELLLRLSVELDSVQEGGVGPGSLGLSDNLSVVFPKMNLEGMVSLRYWAWHQATQAEYKAIMGESSEEPESDVEVEVNGAAVADTRVLHSEEKEAQMMESS